jgi:xanthine dehydrogenase YagT iron-sulfur-binding subunit
MKITIPATESTAGAELNPAHARIMEQPLIWHRTRSISCRVNGRAAEPIQIPIGLMMIDFLHEYLNLTGSRLGCGQGICHACVVILDHPDGSCEEVRTCITGAHFFDGKQIRTIEAHATRNAQGEVVELSAIQQKFLEYFSFQCGYCTPGFVNATTVLLEKLKQQPIARDQVESAISAGLGRHICRCTGYVGYYAAVKDLVMNTPGLVKDAKA